MNRWGKKLLVAVITVTMVYGLASCEQSSQSSDESTINTQTAQIEQFKTAPMVAAGGEFTCALKKDGTVWYWGINPGNGLSQLVPTEVKEFNHIISISAGSTYVVALKKDGTVWTWGNNIGGQLGLGNISMSDIPQRVEGINDAIAVSAGHRHTVVLRKNSTAVAFGNNRSGQLGSGLKNNHQPFPVPVEGISDITVVEAGYNDTIFLKADGSSWSVGDNNKDGKTYFDSRTGYIPVPLVMENIRSISISKSGDDYNSHTVAVKNNGSVWAWGSNSCSQLGVDRGRGGSKYYDGSSVPVQVPGLASITSVSSGNEYSIALTANGEIWGWGSNNYGQLCQEDRNNSVSSPIRLNDLNNVIAVSAIHSHVVALRNDGTVWTWGSNDSGELGIGTSGNARHGEEVYTKPMQVLGSYGQNFFNVNE